MKQPWYKRLFQRDTPPPVAIFPHLPPHERECPTCKRTVTHWFTYANDTIRCAECHQRPVRARA